LKVSFTNNGNKKLINDINNESTESNPYVRFKMLYLETAIFPPIDNRDHYQSMIIKDNLQQMTITQIDILIYSDKVLLTYRVIINLF
jgi:hypothetical protein